MPGFSTILIANRGEIACRILRSAHALGYRSVAVFSDADADARHVDLADMAVCIGPAPASESYLSISSLIAAARRAGADAIHPGYGFLSENEAFASACAEAGITFIGPPAEAIQRMGNKAEAKRLMLAAGVPCVPGYSGEDQSDERLLAEAPGVGFPLLVKAAAGGGGRGMRLVESMDDFVGALAQARSEAKNAFGSDEVILERAVIDARHVEIQVFADSHGACLHLGERDCSVQRRHQKVIEEAPSPAVNADLRARMGAAAVQAAQTIGYVGAGTVEFLLGQDGEFYFLEMNTRLQVEHPVTELCTGLDLVELQLKVAAGEPLPLAQADVALRGHAIEVRLYAEDPYNGFLPQAGPVVAWRPALADGVHTRVDHGLNAAQEITPFYDPMVAKVIAHGDSREDARRRVGRALRETVLLGPPHNKRFLLDVLDHPTFIAGEATTRFVESDLEPTVTTAKTPSAGEWALAALLWAAEGRKAERYDDPWRSNEGDGFPLELTCGDVRAILAVRLIAPGRASVGGCPGSQDPVEVALLRADGPRRRVAIDGLRERVHAAHDGETLLLERDGALHRFAEVIPRGRADAGLTPGDGSVRSPTIGRLIALPVAVGDEVEPGTVVAIVEAMKIETSLTAGVRGIVASLHAEVGAQVKARRLLVTIDTAT